MRFLRSRGSPPQPSALGEQLDSIALFHSGGVTEGLIPRSASRLSDELNQTAAIRVRVDGVWADERTDDIIAVAAEQSPQPSPNRMARRRHILELTAPPYRVRGTAYMPAGADPLRYVRAVPHRWLALTDATVLADDGSGYEVRVLLVNMDHVART